MIRSLSSNVLSTSRRKVILDRPVDRLIGKADQDLVWLHSLETLHSHHTVKSMLLELRSLNEIGPSKIEKEKQRILVIVRHPLVPLGRHMPLSVPGVVNLEAVSDIGDLPLRHIEHYRWKREWNHRALDGRHAK